MIYSIKKLYSNVINSINGFKIVFKEHSFKIELFGGIFLILFLSNANIENIFKVLILMNYFFLLTFEVVNTCIEKISDKINKNFDIEIKNIKDMSSTAVFLILIMLILNIIFSLIS